MNKTQAAFWMAAAALGDQRLLYMWTITFKEVLPVEEARKKWNRLLTSLMRRWDKLCGLRVFELHEEHGLHVHLLTNRFIDVNEVRRLAEKAGWGRPHVEKIPKEKGAAYLLKHLENDRPECLKGWRLWAGFGSWEWTKVSDVVVDSMSSRIYRACKEWLQWTGKTEFFARARFVEFMEMQTIINGWEAGLGPDGKPYWLCSLQELGVSQLQIQREEH